MPARMQPPRLTSGISLMVRPSRVISLRACGWNGSHLGAYRTIRARSPRHRPPAALVIVDYTYGPLISVAFPVP